MRFQTDFYKPDSSVKCKWYNQTQHTRFTSMWQHSQKGLWIFILMLCVKNKHNLICVCVCVSQRSDASCEYWEISSLTQILDDNDDGDVSVCASVCTCVWFGSWWPASALHSPLVQSVTVWAWQCLFQTQTYKYDCWSSYPTHPSHVHLLCFKREGGLGSAVRGGVRQLPPIPVWLLEGWP